jgi:hypothetical protein
MSAEFLSDAHLQTVLLELENDRKLLRSIVIKCIIAGSLGILCCAAAFILPGFSPWGFIAGALLFISIFFIIGKRINAFAAYKNNFKLNVIGSALSYIDPSLKIEPDKGLSEREFISAQLFDKNPDKYDSEDQVSGTAAKTSFYFSEVHAQYKSETTDKNGKTQTEWHDIFKGIIFTADFNKNFKGVTKLRPKNLSSTFSAWLGKAAPIFASSESKLVELENIEFGKTFITHATDQIEARYILTPALMDKLCRLNEKSSDTISLTFIKSRVYIVFPLSRNYFEPPLFKSLLRPGCLEEDLSIIQFMYDIITDLDLNTRIWGKA